MSPLWFRGHFPDFPPHFWWHTPHPSMPSIHPQSVFGILVFSLFFIYCLPPLAALTLGWSDSDFIRMRTEGIHPGAKQLKLWILCVISFYWCNNQIFMMTIPADNDGNKNALPHNLPLFRQKKTKKIYIFCSSRYIFLAFL